MTDRKQKFTAYLRIRGQNGKAGKFIIGEYATKKTALKKLEQAVTKIIWEDDREWIAGFVYRGEEFITNIAL